ncbi:hypothetical protein EJB05_33273, partial [Eragrostis curvula]
DVFRGEHATIDRLCFICIFTDTTSEEEKAITFKMMGSHGFCLFILLTCFIPISVSAENNDIRSLFTLRDAVTEGKGFLRNWFHSEIPPCSWSGISCVGRTVVAIDLSPVPVYAPFPSCIGSFRSLVRLDFSHQSLLDTWGNLQLLQYLDLSNNQLTGVLPASLYGFKMLKEMVLARNFFSGQLSSAIGQLPDLKKFSISVNSISGALPLELGALQNLEFLDFHANTLSGSIPATFGNLSRLLHLDANQNNLTGSIFRE